MSFKYLVDSHTHSDHSIDGTDPVPKMCERADILGLYAITITDHCEIDEFVDESAKRAIIQSYYATYKAKCVFSTETKILCGAEFGQPCHDLNAAQAALAARPYDFILGSIHHIKNEPDFYYLNYKNRDAEDLLSRYFDELAETVEWGQFDSLAHLTYPLRYMIGEYQLDVDISKFNDKIDDVLRLLAEKGKALEINGSGLRQKIGVTLPTVDYVRRFKELGGEMITVGSDAHRCEDVAKGVEVAMQCALDAGFKSIVYFENRKPKEIEIIKKGE